VFLAQITKVDHLPPAAANARCSVCSSELLMHPAALGSVFKAKAVMPS
jgi:hypothetical protein